MHYLESKINQWQITNENVMNNDIVNDCNSACINYTLDTWAVEMNPV